MTTQVEHVFIVFLCHLRHQKILHWVGAAMPAHAHPLLLYFVYHCLKPVNVVVFKVVLCVGFAVLLLLYYVLHCSNTVNPIALSVY